MFPSIVLALIAKTFLLRKIMSSAISDGNAIPRMRETDRRIVAEALSAGDCGVLGLGSRRAVIGAPRHEDL
ncbi:MULTISPECIES: hypothetical protein [unclassified Bradyrhizobium]|uniref:hypothetical protein n=1 Tax=unclassified Bradyrhizobium TaxID=2631580 RepID=UPI001FF9A629|nr:MULTISPECIES: hypothetical protein [unclassified Bradyrhizobium]MCK1711790.1 hypothetical protein [Bradyrhizobium sp. 143]MCK1730826.1 hypothetical protein [Bradyrhizobium sp. 142]